MLVKINDERLVVISLEWFCPKRFCTVIGHFPLENLQDSAKKAIFASRN